MTDWRRAREQDLRDLITDKEQESHYLDFKRRESLLTVDKQKRRVDLGKDVSSFAHADGGTIIYGMIEEGAPGVADGLAGFSAVEMSKERLTQLIQTSTSPPVSGVFVRPVELTQSDPGKWAYVVSVPQAETVHQALDMRFHRRDNADTRAMHRDEILDVLNRSAGPRLHVRMSFENGGMEQRINWNTAVNHSHHQYLAVSAHNQGKIALHALFRLFIESIPEQMQVSVTPGGQLRTAWPPQPPQVANAINPYSAPQHKLISPPQEPIFMDDSIGLGQLGVVVRKSARDWDGEFHIFWLCIAPHMVNAEGGITVRKQGDTLAIVEMPSAGLDGASGP